jgi:hypothetical protein
MSSSTRFPHPAELVGTGTVFTSLLVKRLQRLFGSHADRCDHVVGVVRLHDYIGKDALELTWRSLSEVGNISSASVLHVLCDTMAKQPPSGSPGVLMAMGPGFCSEVVLLRWH